MAEARTYTGGCHCGAVRYQAVTDLAMTMTCNCSRCAKLGIILSPVPASAFTLTAGADMLTDYQFNKMVIHHLFCRQCGIQPFARGKGPDGSDMVALNVRCLDGVDLDSLAPTRFNGRDI